MKKTTLVLAACLIGIAALKAQIVVTQADFPVVGDKFVVVNDSNPAISPLPQGPAVAWNYSTLGTSTTDTLKAILPSATGFASFYPASNLALSYSLPGIKYAFVNITASALALYGVVEPIFSIPVPVVYKPQPQNLYIFPMDYLSNWSGLTGYRLQAADTSSLYDSIRIESFTQYKDTVDSWGNCSTPLGTYSVLRLQAVSRILDSLFGQTRIGHVWTFINRSLTKDTSYDWIANGLNYPLLSMHMQNGSVHYASWLKSVNAGIDEITDKAGSQVYPNPANTVLNIKLVSCQTGTVSVMDITGRQISTTAFSNQLAIINTSALSNGMYFYRIADKTGNFIDAGKFTVVK